MVEAQRKDEEMTIPSLEEIRSEGYVAPFNVIFYSTVFPFVFFGAFHMAIAPSIGLLHPSALLLS